MQILESSVLGLRTARLLFRNPSSPVSVTLYPMVHVGEERFYTETYDEAFAHDVVLVEGIRSPVGRNLTRSYRWLDLERLGMVRQPKTPSQDSATARIVRADLTTEEFHQQWFKVSLALRALFRVVIPIYALHRRIFATRVSIARNMSLEDRHSADEILSWSPTFEPVTHSILHARDERLLECLAAELDSAGKLEKRVAVVYGARHMRAVVRELTKLGFHCSKASWQTIFSI